MSHDGPWHDAARGANLLTDGRAAPTVFARMSARAAELGAMNLGQGFPDTDPPAVVAEAAVSAIRDGANQYPPGPGTAVLREAISAHQQDWYGLSWDPAQEVLVTTGATEAIAATILALVSPGDEVLTLEPFYDSYAAMIALAGGVHTTVPMRPGTDEDGNLTITVDPAALASAVTDRTRLILLNTPHNPTGVMLDEATLTALVAAAEEHDALIASDEVYEHLVLEGTHRPVAVLPGAQDRTVTFGSAGKTFSVTGWKIGWVTARADLVMAITAVKQWLTFTSGAPFQPAVAAGLAMPPEEITAIATDLRERRDRLVAGLRGAGWLTTVPEAGYFVLADATPFGEPDAADLCERLPEEAGVVGIPVSAFQHPGSGDELRSWVRFAFCKDDDTLTEALRRLEAWARR